MAQDDRAESLLVTIHEERIQAAEHKLSELEASNRAHEEVNILRFEQIANKIDELGDRIVSKIETIQDNIDEVKRNNMEQDVKLRDLWQKDSRREKRKKRAKDYAAKMIWPGVAIISAALGQKVLVFLGLMK